MKTAHACGTIHEVIITNQGIWDKINKTEFTNFNIRLLPTPPSHTKIKAAVTYD